MPIMALQGPVIYCIPNGVLRRRLRIRMQLLRKQRRRQPKHGWPIASSTGCLASTRDGMRPLGRCRLLKVSMTDACHWPNFHVALLK